LRLIVNVCPSGIGRRWRVSIDADAIDAEGRWIELTVCLPIGVVNHERVTLTEVDEGHTVVRLN
jgi:hypothetical protein